MTNPLPKRKDILRSYSGLILILAFLFFFRLPISRFLDSLLVKPILSGFDNTPGTNLVMVLLAFIFSWFWWRYADTKLLFKIGFFVFIAYTLERLNPYWTFQHSSLIPTIYVWDITIIPLVIPTLKFLFETELDDPLNAINVGFAEDMCINTEAGDTFKRRTLARKLAKTISITINKQSFAIGILGEYGSGKTSFIQLIRLYLDDKTTTVIDFNPWSSENTPNIHKDFFDLLARKMFEIDPKLSGLVLDYSRKLSRLDSAAEKLIKQVGFISSLFQRKGYKEDYELINDLLKKCPKKIVVCIDDLDRLHAAEVMEILKLIRNTAGFANVFYLVAYEKGYVQEAIRTVNPSAVYSYLDKIIQLEIPLPKREGDDLLVLLKPRLKNLLSANHLSELDEVIRYGFKFQSEFAFPMVFRNSRDVIKFYNSFSITYDLLGNEVVFGNLFVLELLKFRFPLIYDRLYERPKDMLFSKPHRSTHDERYELRTIKDGEVENLMIRAGLKEQKYADNDIDLICSLVKNLFNPNISGSKDQKNSIIYPMFFERYFRYRISGKEISEKSYQDALTGGLDSLTEYIDQCVDAGMHEQINDRIFQEKTEHRSKFEFVIAALFYLGPKYVALNGVTSFDNPALLNKLWNIDGHLTRKYYNGNEQQYANFLNKLFVEAPSPYLFHNQLIFNLQKEPERLPISHSQLMVYQINYFKGLVALEGLSKDALWIMWGAREYTLIPDPNKPGSGNVVRDWKFAEDIIPLIREYVRTKDPFYFLADSIERDITDTNSSMVSKKILGIFDTPQDLQKLAEESTFIPPDIKNEYLRFFDLCATVQFSRNVPFIFTTRLKYKRNEG